MAVKVFEGKLALRIHAESAGGVKGARSPMRRGDPKAFRQEIAASAGAASSQRPRKRTSLRTSEASAAISFPPPPGSHDLLSGDQGRFAVIACGRHCGYNFPCVTHAPFPAGGAAGVEARAGPGRSVDGLIRGWLFAGLRTVENPPAPAFGPDGQPGGIGRMLASRNGG